MSKSQPLTKPRNQIKNPPKPDSTPKHCHNSMNPVVKPAPKALCHKPTCSDVQIFME